MEKNLCKYNEKLIHVESFKNYIAAINSKDMLPLRLFYQDKKWRKWKFRIDSNGRKSMDNFINKIGK